MKIIKCIKCGKKGIGRLSPDLDIDGIGFCEKHKEDVMLGYYALLKGDKETTEIFFKKEPIIDKGEKE